MSKFLTPPVWYDKNGNLNEMLTGNAGTSSDIAIGSGTTATGGGIAIGGNASNGGIAIGHNATAGASGCIVIGDDANASTSNTIQLGNNNTKYTLNVGDGDGVTSGYIEKGISYPNKDFKYGFVDVSYSQDVNYVREPVTGGIYIVRVKNNAAGYNTLCTFLFEIDGRSTEYSSMFEYDGGGEGTELKYAVIKATPHAGYPGMVTLSVVDSVEYGTGPIQEHKNFTISIRRISKAYLVG